MKTVDEFIAQYVGEPNVWLTTFVEFMRESYPDVPETIAYQKPTYKFPKTHIAFSVAKNHFTFHTPDVEGIEELKSILPLAKFGKSSAKVKFVDKSAQPALMSVIDSIVERHSES